ncbi:hypothetical protein BGZ68_009019 [Mortierella alpina]|nr:hypothetical protein BGZ68_009019 [Mortierella alpina]
MSATGPTFPAYDNSPHAIAFLGRRSVRDTWITLWVLWLIWALLFLTKQTFGAVRFSQTTPSTGRVATGLPVTTGLDRGPYVEGAGSIPGDEQGPTVVTGAAETSTPVHAAGTARTAPGSFFSRAVDNMRDRILRTHNLVRDLTLMLLLVVTLNTFGLGSGIAVLVLSWIYVSVAFSVYAP